MKFLCDNCKAKYQIGDDKVAGKTVRMKCRRCGHSITVSSKVTESSVSRPFPEPSGEPAPASASGSHQAPVGAAPQGQVDDESTQIMVAPMMMMPSAPAAPARPSPVGVPRAPVARPMAPAPAPRPFGVVPAAPQPGAPRPLVALRSPSGGAAAPARDLRQQPEPARAPTPHHVAQPQPAAAQLGVAAAFQRAVADPQATAASSRVPPHEDWYVGVGGVPLGPVRIDVVREKAQLGQVDGESLVWREGFDEWQPLKKFPELLEVVETARAARLAAAAPRTVAMSAVAEPQRVPDSRRPGLSLAAGLASPAGGARPQAPSAPPAPAPQAAPAAYSPYAPFAHAAPAAPAGAAPYAPSAAPAPPAAPAPVPLADPFKMPSAEIVAPAPLVASPTPIGHDASQALAQADLAELIPRRQSMNPMAYAFIAMAAVFGGFAAYFVFFKAPPQAQIVVVEKTVQVPGAATGAPSTVAESTTAAPSGDATASPTAKTAGGPGHRAPVAATPGTPVAPIETIGGHSDSPRPSPNAGSEPPPSAGGSLSQGEIQGVVSANQARIRRSCWEPALQGHGSGGPASAKVSAQLTIGPSGSVESASASGADAFPGLASCIAGRMKSWKFPPSGGSQTVNVPFVFAAQ